MTQPIVISEPTTVVLSPPTPKMAIEGEPQESALGFWKRDDSKIQVGVWECTPGVFATERIGMDEVVYLLSGRGVLVSEDGTETPHAAGDVLIIPDGFKGVWHIHETLRKFFVGTIR